MGNNNGLILEIERRREVIRRLLRTAHELERLAAKPPVLLKEVVKGACEVTSADCAVLYSYDSQREGLAEAGVGHGLRQPLGLAGGSPAEARMVVYLKRDSEVAVSNLSKADPILLQIPFIKHEGIQAFMAIALRSADELLGILYLNFRSPHEFPEEEKDLIRLFSHHASVAIQNSRLLQQRQVLHDRALVLADQAAAASRHAQTNTTTRPLEAPSIGDVEAVKSLYAQIGVVPLPKLLADVVEQAARLTPAKYVGIWLLDDQARELRLGARNNHNGASAPGVARLPLDQRSITTYVALTRKAYHCRDVTADPYYSQSYDDVRSQLAVPLVSNGRALGTFNLESTEPGSFTDDHLQLVEALARAAAAAIREARLYDRLGLLDRVGQILTTPLDLDSLLRCLLQELSRTLAAHRADVYLINRATGELELQAHQGKGAEDVRGSVRVGQGLVGRVAERKEPLLIPDVRKDARAALSFKGTRCSVAVPIKFEERTIGVLSLEHAQPHAFDKYDVRLLQATANQVASAIRNAQLSRTRETVSEVGQFLTGRVRLKEAEVLELISGQAAKFMNTDNMYIALYDEMTDTVRFGLAFVKGKQVDVGAKKGWQPRRGSWGQTEWIIDHREPIFISTRAEAEDWHKQAQLREHDGGRWASGIGVPMMLGEKVLGVIAVYDPDREFVYDVDDLYILSVMAGQAAVALDNARLFYGVNQRLETLVEASRTLTSGLEVGEEQVLELIYNHARKLMKAENLQIALYDEPTDTVRFGLAIVKGERVDVTTQDEWRLRSGVRGWTDWVIQHREPLLITNKAEAQQWARDPAHQGYSSRPYWPSWMGVPMIANDRVLGAIAVYDAEREFVYEGEDLMILRAMANQAAIALDNVRLYQHARSEVVAAKQLATLGTMMAALQHRINNTFNIIVPNLTRLKKRINMDDPTVAEIIDIVERNARHTAEIINRVQQPLGEEEIQDIDLNALLAEVVKTAKELRADSTKPFVRISLDLDPAVPHVQAPFGQLSEVFRNLIDNAFRAMSRGGQLVVSSRFSEGKISIRVQDSGAGIPRQVRQRLFAKPVTSSEPGAGAGLGLWLSNLVLRSIGGRVIIEKSDADGTTMLVQIPLPAAGASPALGRTAQIPKSRRSSAAASGPGSERGRATLGGIG